MQNLDHKLSRIDQAIEWLLYALLAFMPFAFGTVEAWSQEVLMLVSAAIGILFAMRLYLGSRLILSFAYIPVILFIILIIFQLFPLPASVIGLLSPQTASIKQEMLTGISGDLGKTPLSFYPDATVIQLRLVLALSLLFFVVLNVFTTADRIKRLLTALTVIGGAVAVIALLQVITGADKIYWTIPIRHNLANSGPFVNHSNFGQFMNLSIGAALGLLFTRLHEAFTGHRFSVSVAMDFFESDTGRRIWFIVAMIVLGAASVFVSLTRGGMVSMLIGAGFTTLLITSRRSVRGRGWIMVLAALGAFICVLYIGFDAVYDRLATLGDLQTSQGGRTQILKDIALAWTKFPLFGTGLGTHEVVYPMFDRSTIASLAGHAENEYAQLLEEMGLAGFLSMLLFGVIVWSCFAKCIRTAKQPIRSAAYGLGFGLIAILIHSLSDFGQHLPANAAVSVIFCALLIILARPDSQQQTANTRQLIPIAFVLVMALGLLALTFYPGGANDASLAQSHWKKALKLENALQEKNWQGTSTEFKELISTAANAVRLQPGNVHYMHWLNVYRWRSMIRTVDPETNVPIIPKGAGEFFVRLVNEFEKATVLCPTFGPSYCMAGQLQQLTGDSAIGADNIRKGYRLAPCDATVCFVAGMLDISQTEPNSDSAIRSASDKFKRAIELDSRLFTDVAGLYVHRLKRPDLALDLAGDNTGRLSRVANMLAETDEHSDIIENTRAFITDLLEKKCSQPDAPAYAFISLASIYRRDNQYPEAINYYRKALAADYGNINWRLTLARLLAKDGKIQDAIHEARIILRLKPNHKPAIDLIAKLSILPEALGSD